MIVTVVYAKPKMTFPIGSWLIRLVEGTKGSHVGLYFDLWGYDVAFDSVAPRSRVMLYKDFLDHYEILKFWQIEIPDSERVFLTWCMENVNKKYSRLQCILIGTAELFGGWVSKLIRKQNPNGNDYLICVEAVVRFLIKFKDFKFDKSPDLVGLKELVEKLDNK